MFLSWNRLLLLLLFVAGILFTPVRSAFAACPNFNIPTTTTQCAGGNCGAGTSFPSTLVEEPGKTYRYEWNFGDPDSGPANTSDLKQPNHTFSQPGDYTVSVKVFVTVGGVETEDTTLGCSETVKVAGVPDFKLNVDNADINLGPQEEEVCLEDLKAGVPLAPVPATEGGAAIPASATFLWSNGSTDPTITVKEEGCYSVTVTTTVDGVTCSRTNKVQVWGYKPPEQGEPGAPPPPQQARWYFGNGAGVKFQGVPQAVTSPPGAVNTPEGSSTVLDRKGNLLFYTDGRTVFDTVGVALPNGTGLAGGLNSTQAVLIVPQPGCNSCDPVYYVFTTGDITPTGSRLEYNVVDMRLNPPKGGVVPNQKNQLLTQNSTERVISIKGQSDPNAQNPVETTWIVTHDFAGNTFRVYPLTPSGLGSPQTYPGAAHTDPANGEGYMKSFPYTDPATGETKTRIAVVVPGAPGQPNRVELFDFDPATGAVSGPASTVDLGDPKLKAYGVEFAGDYMYVSLIGNPPDSSKIVRYDLNPAPGLTVANTREEIVKDPAKIGTLQAGPDGAIYVAVQGAASLWSIASPTAATAAEVGLNRDAIKLNGPTSNLGLPTNADPQNKGYGQSFSFEQPACAPAGTNYTIQFQANPDRAPRNDGQPSSTFLWTFHDGSTSTLQNPTKAYLSPGEYIVNLTITNDCKVEVMDQDTVFIYEAPPPIPPRSASACYGSPVLLDPYPGAPGPADVTYTWILPNGTARSGKTLNITRADAVPGLNVFRVVVANKNCAETGIFQVNFTQPQVNLGPDVSDCEVTTLVLDAGNPGMQYQWKQNGTVLAETGRTLSVRPATGTTTTYEVTVTDPLTKCTASDQIQIVRGAKPGVVVDSEPANSCTSGDGKLIITYTTPGTNELSLFRQSDGQQIPTPGAPTEIVLPPGGYRVVVKNGGCETTVLAAVGNANADAPKIIGFSP
ncbi:MAG TPA: PKD domain-containing protein, partial [Cytophagales bacterium]